jgi:hypothetical protein
MQSFLISAHGRSRLSRLIAVSETVLKVKVLEIYPNDSWWFEAEDAAQIEQLRAAADPHASDGETNVPGRAFHLVGNAAAFDLIPGVFDEIIVHYEPSAMQRLNLEKRMRTWIHPTGSYRFAPDFPPEEVAAQERREEYRPLNMYIK